MRRLLIVGAVLVLAGSAAYATDYTYVGGSWYYAANSYGWQVPTTAGNYNQWDNADIWDQGSGYPGDSTGGGSPNWGYADKAIRTGLDDKVKTLMVPGTIYLGEFYADNGNFYNGRGNLNTPAGNLSSWQHWYISDDCGHNGDFTWAGDAGKEWSPQYVILEADGHVRITGYTGAWNGGTWSIIMNGGTAAARKELIVAPKQLSCPMGYVTISEGAYVQAGDHSGGSTYTKRPWVREDFTLNGNYAGDMEATNFYRGPGSVWASGTAYANTYTKTGERSFYGGTYANVSTLYPTIGVAADWSRTIRLKGDMTCEDFIANEYMTVKKTEQTFVPRSKRRRIRKKCMKKYGMSWQEPNPDVFLLKEQGLVFGHPATIEKLGAVVEKHEPFKLDTDKHYPYDSKPSPFSYYYNWGMPISPMGSIIKGISS